jgi:hypothetical protein
MDAENEARHPSGLVWTILKRDEVFSLIGTRKKNCNRKISLDLRCLVMEHMCCELMVLESNCRQQEIVEEMGGKLHR